MTTAFQGLGGLAGLVVLICYIVVLLAMFKAGQSGLAIVCILLSLCFGVGFLVAFVVGWQRSSEWNLKNVMIIYTVALLICFIGGGAGYALR